MALIIPEHVILSKEMQIAVDEVIQKTDNFNFTLIHLILKFIQPTSVDHFKRCQIAFEYLLPEPEIFDQIIGFDQTEFEQWLYRVYGTATLKKFFEFKDLPGPDLETVLSYQFPNLSSVKLNKFLSKLSTTERIVLSVWLDRIADPHCAMLKAGVYNKFHY